MATIGRHSLQDLGPVHPPLVEKNAIQPSPARRVEIRVKDPLDHSAPAILHEPPRTSRPEEAKSSSAVIMVSGAGGGVSGPAGNLKKLFVLDYEGL